MKRRIIILICAVCMILALVITLYPLISNVAGEKYRSMVETRYDKAVEKLNTMELIAEKEEAVLYNRTLQGGTENAFSRETLAQAEQSYSRLLNVRGDGIMGYVQIPKIGVELPIYHGTAEETLDKGVGHLLGTSLPVGGIGTHCVLTGHSGLAGTRMFSDLDQLKKGDVFYLKVLDETHAYMILGINTVLPEDTSKLTVDPQREMEIRKIPFGYEISDGAIQINTKESSCVLWIFTMYNTGASLGDIAKELNARRMTQYNKASAWNKNMIDRILQDQRYSGDALYPEIISEKLFNSVQHQRNIRSHTKLQTPAQRMIRILGGGRVNDTVEAGVLAAMNRLICNPDALQSPVPPAPDQTKRFRTQRALDAALGQQPIDEDRAAELIKALAEAEYELIENNIYETERLRRIFLETAPMEELSADLLRKTVAEISVEIKAIKLTMKNKQIIEVSDVS